MLRRIFWRYWLRRIIRQRIGCVGFGHSIICGVAMQGKGNFWRYWLSRSRARRGCCDDGFGSVCGCVGFGCVILDTAATAVVNLCLFVALVNAKLQQRQEGVVCSQSTQHWAWLLDLA